MTDQQLNCETNQDKDGMPEESIQQRMGDQGPENPAQPPMATPVPENAIQPSMADQDLENPVQPQMADQGPENPAQPPMAEQAPENSVPNRGLLTLVFFVNMGLLMLFIGSALIAGGWAIVFLFFLGYYLTCYIAATVLLGIGTKTANKTMLFVSVALYFASILFAGDPAWLAIQIPSMISTVLVLIGTLLL